MGTPQLDLIYNLNVFLLTHHREILVPLFKVSFYGTHLSFVMNHILKKKVVKTKQAKSLNKTLKEKILFVIHFVHKAMFLHTYAISREKKNYNYMPEIFFGKSLPSIY